MTRSPLLAVLDFEGTSTTTMARATEIGICLVNRELRIVSEYETLIRPTVEPLKASLGMARLSRNDLADAPKFKDVWPDIYSFFDGNSIIAHNKSYEITVLENEFKDMGLSFKSNLLCTRELSRRLLGHRISAENLDYLCGFFDIQRESPHEALGDARDTVQLLRSLVSVDEKVLEELFSEEKLHSFEEPNWSSKPAKIRNRISTFELDDKTLEVINARINSYGFKLVVVTGKPEIGIEEFRDLLKRHGLENRETPVTQKTAFVVRCAEKPGNSKIRKAQEEKIPVIEESQLQEVLLSLRGGRF